MNDMEILAVEMLHVFCEENYDPEEPEQADLSFQHISTGDIKMSLENTSLTEGW